MIYMVYMLQPDICGMNRGGVVIKEVLRGLAAECNKSSFTCRIFHTQHNILIINTG